MTVEGEASALLRALAKLPFAPNALHEGNKLKVMLSDEAQAPDVVAALVKAGARIHSVARAARPLEEAYLELVREEDEA